MPIPPPTALLPLIGLLALAAPVVSTAAEADADGAALHRSHCAGCHGTEVYTRANRMVTSLPALEEQVQRCVGNQNLDWSDDDIGEVTTYLNHHFYHFGHSPH